MDKGNGVNATNFWSAGASVIRAESCISKKMTCGSRNSRFSQVLWHIHARTHGKCFRLHCCTRALRPPATLWRDCNPFALRRCHNIRIKQFPSGSTMGILPVWTTCTQNTFSTHVKQNWALCKHFYLQGCNDLFAQITSNSMYFPNGAYILIHQ